MRLRLILFGVLIAGLWLAVRNFGPLGAIVVVVSINLFEHLVITYRSARIIGVKKSDVSLLGDLAKLGLAAGIGALGAVVVRPFLGSFKPFYVLAITGSIFLFFYVATTLLLGVPTPVEREGVLKRIAGLERFLFWRRGHSLPEVASKP